MVSGAMLMPRPFEARELTLAALGVAFPLLCCPI